MAFISEIDFRGGGGVPSGEFVEVTLGPNDDPADFVVSAYNQNGALWANSGIPGGEVTLSTLIGVPDPDNSDFTIYVIPVGIRNGPSDNNEASGIALTDTSAGGGVVDFFSAASQAPITATNGAAVNGTSTNILNHRLLSGGESYQWDIFGNLTLTDTTSGDAVLCLTGNVYVKTSRGAVQCRDLRLRDLVWTADNGFQPIRWIGHSPMTPSDFEKNEKLRPISICAHALAPGVPKTPLVVSPQHRILVRSMTAKRMFGDHEVLVSARKLSALPGIDVADIASGLTYIHLLFDRHEIIEANGALVESLLLAEQSCSVLQAPGFIDAQSQPIPAGLRPVAQIPCRQLAEGKKSRRLVERLASNNKDIQPSSIPQLEQIS